MTASTTPPSGFTARMTRRALLRASALGASAVALGGVPAAARTLGGTAAAGGSRAVLQLARVWVSSPGQAAALAAFDDTHARFSDGSVELLLWPGDAARLDALGVRFRVTEHDLAARDAERRAAAARTAASDVPGARETYRTLGDYEADLRALADAYPDKARLFALPTASLEGRTIYGIEIATDVAREDGRPVFYMDGLHHAREWPSGEVVIMYAHDLLESYGSDARLTHLVDTTRTVLVPVQNPDGFVRTRDAATSLISANTPVTVPTFPTAVVSDFEYHRKNMRRHTNQPEETGAGIDTNRNYALQWGGSGSSGSPSSQTYRGAAPYSEPESAAIRDLLLSINATCVITHHTYGQLCMRPWGALKHMTSPDEDLQAELGGQMTGFNGYANIYAWQLYDTAGTSRDWAYGATRALVWTYEHCDDEFHPNYAATIPDLYTTNREAFLVGHEAAADPAKHAVISGRVVDSAGGPVAAQVTVSRPTPTETFLGEFVDEHYEFGADAPDGVFAVHANPSSRPHIIKPDEGVVGPREQFLVRVTAGAASREFTVDLERGEAADLGTIAL